TKNGRKGKAIMRICIAVLLFTGSLAAQNKDIVTTGMVNGRFWKHLDLTAKTFYVQGYREGVIQIATPVSDLWRLGHCSDASATGSSIEQATMQMFHGYTIKNGEIISAIDRFFEDPLNARIRIMDAIIVVLEQARGASPQEIEGNIR